MLPLAAAGKEIVLTTENFNPQSFSVFVLKHMSMLIRPRVGDLQLLWSSCSYAAGSVGCGCDDRLTLSVNVL